MSTYPQYASQWPEEPEAIDHEVTFETEIGVDDALALGVDLRRYAKGALDLPVEATVVWNFADGITEIAEVTIGTRDLYLDHLVRGNKEFREYLEEKWEPIARATAEALERRR